MSKGVCNQSTDYELMALNRFREKASVLTDRRVKIIHEIILFMKVIKMYGWELMFKKLVGKVGLVIFKKEWKKALGYIRYIRIFLGPIFLDPLLVLFSHLLIPYLAYQLIIHITNFR